MVEVYSIKSQTSEITDGQYLIRPYGFGVSPIDESEAESVQPYLVRGRQESECDVFVDEVPARAGLLFNGEEMALPYDGHEAFRGACATVRQPEDTCVPGNGYWIPSKYEHRIVDDPDEESRIEREIPDTVYAIRPFPWGLGY